MKTKMSFFASPAFLQLVRYGIVGLTNNALLYLGYLLLVYCGSGEKLAMTLIYMIGVFTSYTFNYKWTFSQRKNRAALIRYIQMHLTGYFINFILLYIFVDRLLYPHQIVQIFAIIIVAFFGFFTCKYFVFRDRSAHQ
ncbi:GtrA family protein [Pseudomonas orientalis]|uniref:GtrA family protein n=1 Tax=Pseudomonas orientalis TaxID=76758 RepID=UPI000F55F8CB